MDISIYPGPLGSPVTGPTVEHKDAHFHLHGSDATFSTSDFEKSFAIQNARVSLLHPTTEGHQMLLVEGWACRTGSLEATYERWQVTLSPNPDGS